MTRKLPMLFAALVLLPACQDGSARLEAVSAQVERVHTQLADADETRRAGIIDARAALPTVGTEPVGAPCPVIDAFDGGDLDFAGPRVTEVGAHELGDAPGPRLAAFDAFRVPFMTELLLLEQASSAEIESMEHRAASGIAPWSVDASLVVEGRTVPSYVPGGAYHAGLVEGALIVWSYEEGRAICASRFAATNSPDILAQIDADPALEAEFESDPTVVLTRDLYARARTAALERLRALP